MPIPIITDYIIEHSSCRNDYTEECPQNPYGTVHLENYNKYLIARITANTVAQFTTEKFHRFASHCAVVTMKKLLDDIKKH